MCRVGFVCLACSLAASLLPAAQGVGPVSPPGDARRAAAIAEFTRKMKEANYPALFDKAAQEFSVPADVLKGIAFAETRWEHLTWPGGETASPDTGMPRPYGIMSLWDNSFFGHSLLEAAQLIGQTPETLKQDPFQNMRGAAALLRKLYDESPKPPGTTESDIESWRYAIRKYCGIPEPELNARHALDIYTFMSQGYHQYGIEWNARPVNLESIRQEAIGIVADEEARKQSVASLPGTNLSGTNGPGSLEAHEARPGPESNRLAGFSQKTNGESASPAGYPPKRAVWWLVGGGPVMVSILLLLALKGKRNRE